MNHKVNSQDIIDLYENEQLVLSTTGAEMKKMSPTWTGEFGIGDIVHVNNEKHRILKLSVHVPNPEATKIKYEVFIGRI